MTPSFSLNPNPPVAASHPDFARLRERVNSTVRQHNADTAQVEAHASIRRISSWGEPHERQDAGVEEVLRG